MPFFFVDTMASLSPLPEANTKFSLALFKRLSEDDNTANIFYSPFSMSSCLAMVMLGARGNTAKQMSEVQHTGRLSLWKKIKMNGMAGWWPWFSLNFGWIFDRQDILITGNNRFELSNREGIWLDLHRLSALCFNWNDWIMVTFRL